MRSARTMLAALPRFAQRSGYRSSLTTLLDQLHELRKEIARVMRPRRGLRMILHAKDWQLPMPHSFHRPVVQINVRHFHFLRQRIRIDGEPMVLRRDRNFAGPQIFHRLIPAAMAEFQFERPSANREPENLMAETNPEDRFLAEQSAQRLVRIRNR